MQGGGGSGDQVQNAHSQRNTVSPWEFPPAVLSGDAAFDAVAHPRRRYLLYALRARADVSLQELADQLAAWETDRSDVRAETDTQRVYVSLYHTHVPTLAECGVVEFDRATGAVTPGTNADLAFAVLDGAGRALGSYGGPNANSRVGYSTES